MQCITCKISIQDISHYGSDLHNFNIKRKLHELTILSAEEFTELLSAKEEPLKATEEQIFSCDFCGKFFKRIKPLENHIRSHFAELKDNHIEINQNNLNTNILTDGVNLFLENSKILAPKRSSRGGSAERVNADSRLMTRDYSIPFERPKCVDQFPVPEKVSNKLDKAKYIVRRFD